MLTQEQYELIKTMAISYGFEIKKIEDVDLSIDNIFTFNDKEFTEFIATLNTSLKWTAKIAQFNTYNANSFVVEAA